MGERIRYYWIDEIGEIMNILYLSNLTGNLFAGPNHSVPAQVKAQSKVDNVFWYNLNKVKREEWTQNGLDCKNLSDYPSERLKDLPNPFCKPDLVVVEEFYCFPFNRLIHDIQKQQIPYVIVPRSELTEQAQRKKMWKKRIANLLYFRKMAQKAIAIQYLSQRERIESGDIWNSKNLVIPNGTEPKEKYKKDFSECEIRAVYIGRYEQYQKGLDILLASIAKIKTELRAARFILSMYGVDQEGAIESMNHQIKNYDICDLIQLNNAVYGQEKESVLIKSDVFIMTSRFEGMPMGMIEALSYALPCVATEGTNLTREIDQYEAGWTAKNDVESVTKALIAMVQDFSNMNVKDKGRNAKRLSSAFSWEAIAEKSHDAYTKMIRGVKSERNLEIN